MIEIAREQIPKEYERVILEEYYDFFANMYGTSSTLFRGKKTFTTDRNKLSKKDKSDQILAASIGALESVAKAEDLEFVLNKESDGRISALARIRVRQDSDIHIADIIFLEYQNELEKKQIVKNMINFLEDYALKLNCQEIYYEVPKSDYLGIELALENGLNYIEEPNKITSIYRTYLFFKDLNLSKENTNEWTLNRKQTKESNKS